VLTPLPDVTSTQHFVMGQAAPLIPTHFVTPQPYRVGSRTPEPDITLTGTLTRLQELQLTLVVVQPTHYYNATLTRQAADNLATWQAAPTFTLTPTPTRAYIWYNGCCWAYWDGAGWVVMPTPVPTISQ